MGGRWIFTWRPFLNWYNNFLFFFLWIFFDHSIFLRLYIIFDFIFKSYDVLWIDFIKFNLSPVLDNNLQFVQTNVMLTWKLNNPHLVLNFKFIIWQLYNFRSLTNSVLNLVFQLWLDLFLFGVNLTFQTIF